MNSEYTIPVRIEEDFVSNFEAVQEIVHELAKAKGWYDRDRNPLD